MDAAEVLRKAASLIEPGGAWTRKALARDANGTEVDPRNTEAVCWCMLGAIGRYARPDSMVYEKAYSALRTVPRIKMDGPTTFNDYYALHTEVVAALRAAAEQLSPTPTKTED